MYRFRITSIKYSIHNDIIFVSTFFNDLEWQLLYYYGIYKGKLSNALSRMNKYFSGQYVVL